jgi:polysaccharide pyruvyl transferase WcaK-like protein
MNKIGILTFHYSNNYGGVLQSLSLLKALQSKGYNAEVINFVPSNYKPTRIINNLGLSRNIFRNRIQHLNIINMVKKISIIKKHSNTITDKFNSFRKREMNLSEQVDENSIDTILENYDVIIVGSDQIWNPSQRKRPEYFLNFGTKFNGRKISYAADSTTEEVNMDDMDNLKDCLKDFSYISVRNEHSFEFVKSIINKDPVVVADPTILYDFKDKNRNRDKKEDYILTYVLGKEIEGTHNKAIEKIKKVYGNLPVYSIKIPTMNFELSNFADKVLYDLDPAEWVNMFRNAKFIYTDSFHGVLFSLKFHKPFLAYYTEKMRSTRFIDLGKRYNIENYIVQNVKEIDRKRSLEIPCDFSNLNTVLEKQKEYSFEFLEKAIGDLLSYVSVI